MTGKGESSDKYLIEENTYAIEDGKPIPSHSAVAERIPFGKMQVGQSVFVPEKDAKRATVAGWANKKGKDLGRKFITRKEGNGTRVWRVE